MVFGEEPGGESEVVWESNRGEGGEHVRWGKAGLGEGVEVRGGGGGEEVGAETIEGEEEGCGLVGVGAVCEERGGSAEGGEVEGERDQEEEKGERGRREEDYSSHCRFARLYIVRFRPMFV